MSEVSRMECTPPTQSPNNVAKYLSKKVIFGRFNESMMPEQTPHMPKVSVVMCFYKEPLQWIVAAVESILGQTFTDFEFIIICDNKGYSEAVGYIEDVAANDSRIRLVINEKNIGLTKSLNRGVSMARGKYIARMDADDIALGERFEKQVTFMNAHPDISVCGCMTHTINDEGKIIKKGRYTKHHNTNWCFLKNVLAHPSVMFRHEITNLRTPLYNEEFRYSQDYELWHFLILKNQKIHIMKDVLLLYRRSRNQISTEHFHKQVGYFKRIHRSLVTNWLINKGIIRHEDCNDIDLMLKKACDAYGSVSGSDKERLTVTIFVLYFSLGTYSWKHKLRYLTDRRLIMFKVGFPLTYRLLTSKKSRKNKTGFI